MFNTFFSYHNSIKFLYKFLTFKIKNKYSLFYMSFVYHSFNYIFIFN